MPLKDAKKRSYNKKYYTDNRERISEKKKKAYQDDLEKSSADSAARTKASYDKDPDSGAKSTARSKASYDKDLPKSREDNVEASYDKVVLSLLLDQRPVMIKILTVLLSLL